jgi:hypothetical protein
VDSLLYGTFAATAAAQQLTVNGLLSTSVMLQLPSYTVANLPGSNQVNGWKCYATNGCKPGESSGAGTGVEVIWTNAAWRRTSDYAAVSA